MQPRCRVIIDNDFSGDPDDGFQLVHHLLSPSVEIPFVIGSHLSVGDGFDPSDHQADNAAAVARSIIDLVGLANRPRVIAGSNTPLSSPQTPIDNEAARAIIDEAMRDDTELPLYMALGAGLTDLASALLIEPRIADRMTAVWVGGTEHPGLADPPPEAGPGEYNLAIDIKAGQTVFNHSRVPVWQVPRDAYRQALISRAELRTRVRPAGAVGAYLAHTIDELAVRVEEYGVNLGETYVMGDNPLVLLTALQASFEPTPSSSAYVTRPMPKLSDDGGYLDNPNGRPLRIYTLIDTRLMFEDLFAKLALHAGR
jgi:inosine-uridine nucleoside N-ribohydrolase